MNFKIVFRGYDTDEVDAYVKKTEEKYGETLAAQKERIIDLCDENSKLNDKVRQYEVDEKAISKSLIDSQKLASEMRGDAEKFAQLTLSRAKIFYATWQAYAKTLIAALSDGEVREFNALSKKIEDIINAYEGNDIAAATEAKLSAASKPPSEPITPQIETYSAMPTEKTIKAAGKLINPVDKLNNAAEQSIDLKELIRPEQTLEELCSDLGLIGKRR